MLSGVLIRLAGSIKASIQTLRLRPPTRAGLYGEPRTMYGLSSTLPFATRILGNSCSISMLKIVDSLGFDLRLQSSSIGVAPRNGPMGLQMPLKVCFCSLCTLCCKGISSFIIHQAYSFVNSSCLVRRHGHSRSHASQEHDGVASLQHSTKLFSII